METGMSQQELKRVEVIALRRFRQINQAEAATKIASRAAAYWCSLTMPPVA
jgi:hypothetical protein